MGKERNRVSMATKTNRRRDPGQTDEAMHIEAFGAELAVAKTLNVYPDLTIREGALPGYDMVLQAHLIQVKRRHTRRQDLLIPHLDESLDYVLVYGAIPSFTVVGYLPGRLVRSLGSWENLSKGPCWLVEVANILSLDELPISPVIMGQGFKDRKPPKNTETPETSPSTEAIAALKRSAAALQATVPEFLPGIIPTGKITRSKAGKTGSAFK
jgi:hypothetical protein